MKRFLLISICIYCQTVVFSQRITTIPFDEIYGGIILVRAQVGDYKDTLNFVFDTGSSHISLDSTTASALGIPVYNTGQIVSGIGGSRKVQKSKPLDFKINGLILPSQDFNINNYDLLTESYGVRIDGIIGYAFISKYILEVNFDSSHINVLPLVDRFSYPKNGYLWRYRMAYIPNADIEYREQERTKAPFYIDCGAGLAFLISEKYAKDSTVFTAHKKIVKTQVEGVGGKTIIKLTTIKNIKIGPYRFRRVPTYIYNDEADILGYPNVVGLVGNDILRRFNWVMNYSKKELHLRPNNFYNDPFDYSYTGLSLYLIDGLLKIVDIVKGSPGDKAGFQVDDVLISVDSKIATSLKQAKELLQDARKALKVIIIRNGKIEELTLRVQSIL
jgi:Aspartyl protease/PDZ domain